MSNDTKTQTKEPAEKPGLVKRLIGKLDHAMKEKADTKAKSGCCCGGKDGKCS